MADDLGEIGVDLTVDATGFRAELQREVSAAAGGAGDRAGDVLSRRFGDAAVRGVTGAANRMAAALTGRLSPAAESTGRTMSAAAERAERALERAERQVGETARKLVQAQDRSAMAAARHDRAILSLSEASRKAAAALRSYNRTVDETGDESEAAARSLSRLRAAQVALGISAAAATASQHRLDNAIEAVDNAAGAATRAQLAYAAAQTAANAAAGGGGRRMAFLAAATAASSAAMTIASVAAAAFGYALLGVLGGSAIIMAIAALTALVATITSLVAAMVPLLGLLGVAPALMFGAAGAAVVLVSAFTGVGDRFAGVAEQFTALRDVLAENFWAYAAAPIADLADSVLPRLESSLGMVAASMGNVFGTMADALHEVLDQETLDTIFGNFSGLLDAMTAASNGAMLIGLVDAAEALSSFLPGIGQAIGEMTGAFGAWLSEMSANGQLEAWFQGGLDALSQFGGLLQSVWSMFSGFFGAVNQGAEGFPAVTVLTDAFNQIAAVLADPAVSEGISSFVSKAMDAMGPLMDGLGEFLIGLGPGLAAMSDAFGPIGEVMGDLLSALGPVISSLVSALVPAISAVMTAIQPLIPVLSDALIGAFNELAPVLLDLAQTLFPPLVDALTTILPYLPELARIAGDLATMLGGVLGDALVALQPLFDPLMNFVVTLIDLAVQLLPILTPIFSILVPIIQVLSAVLVPVLQVITPIFQLLADLLNATVTPAIQSLSQILSGDMAGAMETTKGVTEGVQAAFETFGAAMGTVFTDLYEKNVKPVWEGIQIIIQGVSDWWQSTVVPGWNAAIVMLQSAFMSFYVSWIQPIWNGIQAAIRGVSDWWQGTIVPLWEGAISSLQASFQAFQSIVQDVWANIQNAAKAPVKFVVETVYRDGIKKTFDSLAEAVGIPTRMPPAPSLGFASGGILPGYTPGRDIYDFISPNGGGRLRLSGGEAIMRPEFSRLLGASGIAALNRAAAHGTLEDLLKLLSMGAPSRSRDFATGGVWPGPAQSFASGGIWDAIGSGFGAALDWIGQAGANISAILGDPLGAIQRLILEPMTAQLAGLGGGVIGQIIGGAFPKALEGLGEWFKAKLGTIMGTANLNGYTGGPTLARLIPIIQKYGLTVTDTYGDLAYNLSLGRSPNSYHGDRANPAVDMAGSQAAMFAAAAEIYRMGNWRQVLWQTAGHFDHIHVAKDGGIFGDLGKRSAVGVYDSGGWLRPGELAVNLSARREPTAIFTPEQWGTLRRIADGGGGQAMPSHLVLVDEEGGFISRVRLEAADVAATAIQGARR